MPDITLTLSPDQQHLLEEEYKRMSMAWLRDRQDAPPAFEAWLVTKLSQSVERPHLQQRDWDEIGRVDAVEKLITAFQAHGFALAHIDRRAREDAAAALTNAFAAGVGLGPQRTKRIQELLLYYAKGARDVADAAHVGMTVRTFNALQEACNSLTERTAKSADQLGVDRALGRVEGALAILAIMEVISRQSAREKAELFRRQLEK